MNPASKPQEGKQSPRLRLPGLSVKDGYTPHPFDLEFGVRTSGLVAGRHLKTGHLHDRHSTAYYGVAPSVLLALLKRWQRTKPAAPLQDFTFLDLGAGMGRALLIASQFPFRAVIGVELHPTLARIARKNIALWRAAGRAQAPLQVVLADAVQFPLPAGPCLAFLFNPFGETVMKRLLNAWTRQLATHPARLDILYVNNEAERVLEVHPKFQRLYLGKVPRSRADAIADHKILANQPDGEYASANHEDCSIYRARE